MTNFAFRNEVDMADIELIMPKMGESVAEATITKWLKAEGDQIEIDEPVLEIATDKVDSEIPAPNGGTLKKILFQEDEVVQVGQAIAIISAEGESAENQEVPANDAAQEKVVSEAAPQAAVEVAAPLSNESSPSKTTASGKFLSPLVRNIAKEEGVSNEELDKIQGNGLNNRITKNDILNFVENRSSIAQQAPKQSSSQSLQKIETPKNPAVSLMDGDEIIEMDRMRKMISEHMTMSKRVSAHVTSFVEADVTNMVLWRNKIKNDFLAREGEKITFTPIIMEAVAKAIKEMPMINVSVDGETIIKRKHINLGMATALPSGNLIVPVIKDADQKNLVGLSKSVNDLANRARNNGLNPDEISGGTFTVTNVGTFGNVMGTPIINQPQVAIMAVGAIRKKPAVIETPFGDTIGIRHMMFLSLSYDHRVVDGSLGGSFVQKVAKILEDFDINREF